MIEVKIKLLDKHLDYTPVYITSGASGVDLKAATHHRIWAGGRVLIRTGIAIQLPEGYEMQIRPRSGLALNHGITVLNSPGTIDADYRGEIEVILINLGNDIYNVKRGDRIAQGIIMPIVRVNFKVTEELDRTDRGINGFGSTGV